MIESCPIYFNSIKVRLELGNNSNFGTSFLSFQFHKGTIRTLKSVGLLAFNTYFNSIKVRLEHSLFEQSSRINEISIP